ncbi:hypothetical protein HK098_002104 [Nowakowskiella sp. JEL0407]|nr:hypothetical protein HK098_002104 [Nowakowskiella sp. JEL0407]
MEELIWENRRRKTNDFERICCSRCRISGRQFITINVLIDYARGQIQEGELRVNPNTTVCKVKKLAIQLLKEHGTAQGLNGLSVEDAQVLTHTDNLNEIWAHVKEEIHPF